MILKTTMPHEPKALEGKGSRGTGSGWGQAQYSQSDRAITTQSPDLAHGAAFGGSDER